MNFKKVVLTLEDSLTGFRVEKYDDNITLSLSEYVEDTEKTTKNHAIIKERSTTEVYLGEKEIKQIINALEYIIKE